MFVTLELLADKFQRTMVILLRAKWFYTFS